MDPRRCLLLAIFAAATLVLMSVAWLRSAEYDEQYTLFLTAGMTRPAWPVDAFPAGNVRRLQGGEAGLFAIARDLRSTDVHPPLYFWAVAAWRMLAGASLFGARLASVLCSLAALGVVAAIARMCRIPAATAVLLTIGCYGFAYTGTIARGFALAQLLTLSGVALLLCAGRRASVRIALAAGALLGAATFANYLAAFVAGTVVVWRLIATLQSGCAYVSTSRLHSLRLTIAAGVGFIIWLPADLWFFLAQRQNRVGQFAPFDAASGVLRLARYFAANLFGGLPLYGGGTVVAVSLAALLLALFALTMRQWRGISTPDLRLLLAMAAAAPPIGLLLLGLTFNSTPIELRYLAFAMPFVALLLAGAFATLPRHIGWSACGLALAVQVLALIGLMTRPETMQPARATAEAGAALVGDGVVLVPHGNDGVGIVGAFAIEAPPTLALLVVGKDEPTAQIRARAEHFPRVVLALLGQDADSRTTLRTMREAFADPCWRAAGEGFNVLAFERICTAPPQ